MLTEANFEDKKHLFNGALLEIRRGQIIFGLEAWSSKTGVTIAKLRKLLDMLEKDKMINRQKTNKYSLISITNYALYQDDDRQNASKSQADDNQNATPKEYKNIRIKEDTNGDSVESAVKKPRKKKDAFELDSKKQAWEEAFDVFWDNVERKRVGKAAAMDAFSKYTKDKTDEEINFVLNVICHWYDLYLKEDESRLLPENKKYLQHASTWLNSAPWRADKDRYLEFKKQYYGETNEG
jgi:hypothetical protein